MKHLFTICFLAILIAWDYPSDGGCCFFRVWTKESLADSWQQLSTQFFNIADVEMDTPTKFITVSAVYPDGQEVFSQ